MTGTTLLFVHGTGVRGVNYAAALETIKEQVARRQWAVQVEGCYWGGTPGATLNITGASVPKYHYAGGAETSVEDRETARWAVLYTDPWYELRLLTSFPAAGGLGGPPPALVLPAKIAALPGDAALSDLLAPQSLTTHFAAACDDVLASTELADALTTARGQAPDHAQAISRAIVAKTILRSQDAGQSVISGSVRNALDDRTREFLGGQVMGVSDLLTRPLKGMATWYARHNRGKLTDKTANPSGDIMRYLVRGEAARDFIRAHVESLEGQRVVLLAHSLGGIMSADLLMRAPLPNVAQLITVGSQSPFLYEVGAFPSLEPPQQLPAHFPPWLNLYDHRDLLSYVGGEVFPGRVQDQAVDNGQPFPEAHSAYWTNPAVWDTIETVLP